MLPSLNIHLMYFLLETPGYCALTSYQPYFSSPIFRTGRVKAVLCWPCNGWSYEFKTRYVLLFIAWICVLHNLILDLKRTAKPNHCNIKKPVPSHGQYPLGMAVVLILGYLAQTTSCRHKKITISLCSESNKHCNVKWRIFNFRVFKILMTESSDHYNHLI